MIELRPYDYYEDEQYDNCGNLTDAVLKIDRITVPLCNECVQRLIEDVTVFKETTFCKDCIYWECSSSGVSYGGRCKHRDRDTGHMETCNVGVKK